MALLYHLDPADHTIGFVKTGKKCFHSCHAECLQSATLSSNSVHLMSPSLNR